MSLVLSGERPSAAATSTSTPLGFIATVVVKIRAAIRQETALRSLLDLDEHRLEDLGINRGDLFDAMYAPARPTRLLEERRRARAQRDVLNP